MVKYAMAKENIQLTDDPAVAVASLDKKDRGLSTLRRVINNVPQ